MNHTPADRAPDAPLTSTAYLECGDGVRLAYAATPGNPPTVVFFCGYASDMSGTKARYLEARARDRGQAFLRFDYQGHGASSGTFADGGIGTWTADALSVIGHAAPGPLILVGSSMGAWIMLRTALELDDRVKALVGVAPAPDFSEDLLRPALGEAEHEALERDGEVWLESRSDPRGQRLSRRFLEEGRRHLVLRSPIGLDCPVRLLHGLEDPDVPWQTSLRLASALTSGDVEVTLIKGGGHRLSAPAELERIQRELESLLCRFA